MDQIGDGGGAVRAPTSPRSPASAAEGAGADLLHTQFDIAAAAAAVLDLMNQLGVSGATESNASKVARLANRQAVSAGLDWRAPGKLRQPTGLETQGEIGLLIAHTVLRRRQPHILFENGDLVVRMGELLGRFAFRSASARRRRREASEAKFRRRHGEAAVGEVAPPPSPAASASTMRDVHSQATAGGEGESSSLSKGSLLSRPCGTSPKSAARTPSTADPADPHSLHPASPLTVPAHVHARQYAPGELCENGGALVKESGSMFPHDGPPKAAQCILPLMLPDGVSRGGAGSSF